MQEENIYNSKQQSSIRDGFGPRIYAKQICNVANLYFSFLFQGGKKQQLMLPCSCKPERRRSGNFNVFNNANPSLWTLSHIWAIFAIKSLWNTLQWAEYCKSNTAKFLLKSMGIFSQSGLWDWLLLEKLLFFVSKDFPWWAPLLYLLLSFTSMRSLCYLDGDVLCVWLRESGTQQWSCKAWLGSCDCTSKRVCMCMSLACMAHGLHIIPTPRPATPLLASDDNTGISDRNCCL